jgi:hypothetical protein
MAHLIDTARSRLTSPLAAAPPVPAALPVTVNVPAMPSSSNAAEPGNYRTTTMHKTRVGIGLTVYNGERFLEETRDSDLSRF